MTTPQSNAYSWYIVFLCMVAYIFSFIDRQVISLLIEPIREDLQISDTQFSLLHGLAFAIFYAIMGLPIARLADTRSRPMIIAAGIFFWSIATAFCGVAKNFWQLFAARMAVGAGEAALSPAAYSMISDSFPRSQLGLALGTYSLGSFIGAGLAYLIGGAAIEWVSQFGVVELPVLGVIQPWQMTFFIVGLPGVLVAALFVLTVRDPERKGFVTAGRGGYPIAEVMAYIGLHRRSFQSHYLGFGFLSLALFALLSWAPAFFIRNYGLSPKEVGVYRVVHRLRVQGRRGRRLLDGDHRIDRRPRWCGAAVVRLQSLPHHRRDVVRPRPRVGTHCVTSQRLSYCHVASAIVFENAGSSNERSFFATMTCKPDVSNLTWQT